MVSLKKVGAIAASALFVGATFGAATAATFSSSMLAKSGEAKAQIVVGANAPGKTADTASGQIIVDTTKSELAVAGAGGDLSIKYYVEDLDDDAAKNYGDNNFSVGFNPAKDMFTCCEKTDDYVGYFGVDLTGEVTGNTSDLLMGIRGGLKYDENGDGDLQDANDYLLYNGIYVQDYVSALDFYPAYVLGNVTAGDVVKINGDDYLITKKTPGNGELDIGPAVKKTLVPVATVSIADAVTVSGDVKLQLVDTNSNATTGTLYMIDSASTDTIALQPYLETNVQVIELTSAIHTTSDVLDAYKIFVTNHSATTVSMALAESSQVTTLANDQTDVLGYNKIKIDDTTWATSNTSSTTRDAITVLLGDPISVAKDGDADIPDTLFNMKYSLGSVMNLRRAKITTASSGTKMKSSSTKYSTFLKSDITPTVEGEDVSITYYVQDLDDDTAKNYGDNNFTVGLTLTTFKCCDKNDDQVGAMDLDLTGTPTANDTIASDTLLGIRGSLKYDENGDGDLQDANDYLLYNGMYVSDYVSALDFQMAYILGDVYAGQVVKINGDNYLITKKTPGNGELDIGPAITKSLAPTTQVSITDAQTVSGDIKLQLVSPGGHVNEGTLYLIDSSSTDAISLNTTIGPLATNTTPTYPYDLTTKAHTDSNVLDAYKVWITQANTTTTLSMALAETSQVTTLNNDQTDVLGYYKIKIDDTEWAKSYTSSTTRDRLTVLLGDPLSAAKDSDVDIPDTLFNFKYTLAKELDLRRAKTTTASSGTKMKSSSTKYSTFLKSDITPTVTGGEDKTPMLEIVDEDTADTSMNLVLVGGPVANTLVADLVTAGKSTTDWYASEGDIEVIASAFTTGKYGIVVAGKDRDATKAAAEALAEQIA